MFRVFQDRLQGKLFGQQRHQAPMLTSVTFKQLANPYTVVSNM